MTACLTLALIRCEAGGDVPGTGGRGAGGAVAGRGAAGNAGAPRAGTSASAGKSAGGAGRLAGASGVGGTGRAGASNGGATSGGAMGVANRSGRGGSGASGSGGTSSAGVTSSGATNAGESGAATGAAGVGGESSAAGSDYDAAVLADGPVLYLAMSALSGTEPDLTGHGHDGSYHGGATASATLPNGDHAADFSGDPHYVSVPSSAELSIPTTQSLTWEAWIRPDVLEFDEASDGYVDWMGKCEEYAPTCEWEARMYAMTNSANRCNRLSAYAFNPSAGTGSGAFWEAGTCGTIQAGSWYHVVGEYTTAETPSSCDGAYPGGIDIWVNGVKWNQASHGDTGCMSQYSVVPEAKSSPLNIGTMAKDAWFQGAIAKVAIYGARLTNEQVAHHYQVMTGDAPSGSCASSCSF